MKMNHKIALIKRVADRDGAGQAVENWVALPERWANVLFQSGAEVMRANADVAIKKCSIRIRASRDVDESMRARYQGVEYDIKSVLPDSNDRDFMFLVCEATS